MRIYIAGPMRGLRDFNFPAFFEAEKRLVAQGHTVFNPARRDEEHYGEGFAKSETGNLADITSKFSLREALAADCAWISNNADAIALLPGWETSKGATAERALGIALCLQVIPLEGEGVTGQKIDDSNPKDLVGQTKPQLHLVPPAFKIHVARAMENGAKKYGPYNWRDKKVRMTVYISAAMRHLESLLDGEDVAEDSGIHHLAHAAACCGIILDALECKCLTDDRPKAGCAANLIARFTQTVPSAPEVSERLTQTAPSAPEVSERKKPHGGCPVCGREWEATGICRHGKST